MYKELTSLKQISGMSLIELLVSVAIGMLLMLGLVSSFQTSSVSQRELEKAGQMIENGRYAISLIGDDLRHAGFFDYFYDLGTWASTTVLPDPCETGSTANLKLAMAMPIQGYRAADLDTRPDISGTNTCETDVLTSANLQPGSDILIIRRADTAEFTGTPGTSPNDIDYLPDDVYVQANSRTIDFMFGSASADVPTTSADNNTTATISRYPASDTSAGTAVTRKYHVHVYFVAPCSAGSNTVDTDITGVCQSGDDAVPTLKRLELAGVGGVGGTTKMKIVPLVEGITYFKVEYGIDTTPSATSGITGMSGDGIPDTYVTTPTVAQWPLVVSSRIYILARAHKGTSGYTDAKTYTLTGSGITAETKTPGGSFKHHVFSTEVRPLNLAGRREIPE